MKVAGYLHDIGKLAVPPEILEKPAKLTKEEFMVIKSHTYYTYRVLEPIGQFEAANQWAAFHHEHLSGNGYPFHLKAQDLPLGSRIMAVADVFTALTEDRPYRRGMGPKETVSILNEDAVNSQLDHELVSVLRRHYDQIDGMRASAQRAASEEYVQYRDSQRG
jgi:HD-GYP domain-containing protein (c-di-GMP phosphodiesterase class II)